MTRTAKIVLVTGFLAALGLTLDLRAKETPQLPGGWTSTWIPGVDQGWVNAKKPGHMITAVETRARKKMTFEGASRTDIASGITAMRKLTLEQFGFKDWNLRTFDHETRGGRNFVKMSGSYVRPDNVKVQFLEHQVYDGQKFTQYSYMIESNNPPSNTDEFAKVLETAEKLAK